MINKCDYCDKETKDLYMTNTHVEICADCLNEEPETTKVIDPDADYDRMRDIQIMDEEVGNG